MKAELELEVRERDGERFLCAPTVGQFRALIAPATPASPGLAIGLLSVLGRVYELRLPPQVGACIVTPKLSDTARTAVACGDELFQLAALEAGPDLGGKHGLASGTSAQQAQGIAVLLSQTGRYYDRPAPDRPPFVRVGDEIQHGQPIGLIEVMKTFNQVVYGGAGMPPRARVLAVLCTNESEVRRGQEFLRIEALS